MLWIGAGFAHFKNLEAMTGYAKFKKLPAAKLGVLGSGLTFLIGGILIVLGTWVDLGALLIAITVILAHLPSVLERDRCKYKDAGDNGI
jgi:uncharacterized membrane protein YphA (DoxX/SURF4 family)